MTTMNLLPDILIYLAVGCGEWYLALRRTLACARGEKVLLVCLVFIENILGLWVLSSFIRSSDWLVAICYASGSALGALIVALRDGHGRPPAALAPAVPSAPL
jgi:hypothetical protein